MKTTIEITDSLLQRTREIAARDGETLRSLVEQGLRAVIAQRSRRNPKFNLADASVDGEGLQPEFANAPWERMRDLIYEDRGA